MSLSQAEIEGQAREWFLMVNSGDLSEQDKKVFDHWLSADDAHISAYIEIENTWDMLGELSVSQLSAPEHYVQKNDIRIKRGWISGFLELFQNHLLLYRSGLVAFSIVAMIVLFNSSIKKDDYYEISTQKGEIATVELEDGSRVTLAGLSKARVAFSQDVREIQQLEGEIFYDVAKDFERPFVVDTGRSSTRVTGTQFSVRKRMRNDRIGVVEGSVEVSLVGTEDVQSTPRVNLNAGQQTTANPGVGIEAITFAASEEIIGWKEGSLIYKNEKLAEVVQDLNRYMPNTLRLGEPSLASLEVTLSVKLDDINSVPGVLEAILPVKSFKDESGNIVFMQKK